MQIPLIEFNDILQNNNIKPKPKAKPTPKPISKPKPKPKCVDQLVVS